MNIWESRIAIPDGKVADYQQKQNIRHFKLKAYPIKHKILSGVVIEALGFNGITPGPLIIVEQGQWVEIEFTNETDEAMGLHVHGLTKPNNQDGIPEIEPTPEVKPGQTYNYKFLAWQTGTFFYHSSKVFLIHNGLLGAFIVLPMMKNINMQYIPNYDYIMVLQQWQIKQPEMGKVFPGVYKPNKFALNPNFFTINGKAYPDTSPMYTELKQRVRFRFINKSSASHSMHVHGHDFKVVAIDGFNKEGIYDDTINVASGERWEVELLSNNPGIWPVNGTKTFHQSNNGEAPGGMITRLIYK